MNSIFQICLFLMHKLVDNTHEYFDKFFLKNCLKNFEEFYFFGRFFLTYNLFTIASCRIGVPSILFILNFLKSIFIGSQTSDFEQKNKNIFATLYLKMLNWATFNFNLGRILVFT